MDCPCECDHKLRVKTQRGFMALVVVSPHEYCWLRESFGKLCYECYRNGCTIANKYKLQVKKPKDVKQQ